MKKLYLLTLVISMFFLGCKSDSKEEKTTENEITNEVSENTETYLTIVGKDIWVRETPTDGEVVMKLNDGDKCKILEKGKQETIKGTSDNWYKIEFDGKQGWVFGSQTSVKQEPASNENSDIDDVKSIRKLMNELSEIFGNKQFSKLNNYYYLGDKVFIISNPGAYIVIALSEGDIADKLQFYPLTSVKTSDLLFEKLPDFDMESYTFTKTGCFAEKITEKKIFSKLFDNMKEFGFEPSAEEIKFASELEKVTVYEILITADLIRFYIAKKDGKWLITAIDIHDFSA